MESQRQQIALLHAESEDVRLLSSLLSDEPFDVVPHNDVHTLQDKQFDAQINELNIPATWGVVVCVRSANDAEQLYSSEDRAKDELNQLTGRYKRLLVLADSMDESKVCTYLSAGAHHVLPLADSPRLMQARLIAGLREHQEPVRNELQVGPYLFDLSRRVVSMDGKALGLSPREFEFAHFLFVHRERIIPIPELLSSVWSLPGGEDSRRIDTAACRLRKKMMLRPQNDWQLRRIRREGYELVRTGETADPQFA